MIYGNDNSNLKILSELLENINYAQKSFGLELIKDIEDIDSSNLKICEKKKVLQTIKMFYHIRTELYNNYLKSYITNTDEHCYVDIDNNSYYIDIFSISNKRDVNINYLRHLCKKHYIGFVKESLDDKERYVFYDKFRKDGYNKENIKK